ncbi:MAG: hypothetical protein ACHQVS_00010 [Candidatus Babeliales bacterium]
MNWIKKSGITLLLLFSLGFTTPSKAMSNWYNAPKAMQDVAEALKGIGIKPEAIEAIISLIERLKESGLEVVSQLTTSLNETIQGSSELRSLGNIQRKIEILIRATQEYKAKATVTPLPKYDKEHKRAAAEVETKTKHNVQFSLTQELSPVVNDLKFMTTTVQPVIEEIEKLLNELRSKIEQRIATYENEKKLKDSEQKRDAEKKAIQASAEKPKEVIQQASALTSLKEKQTSLAVISEHLTNIQSTTSTPSEVLTELIELKKEIDSAIVHFKGGLAGVLDDTIKDLTDGLSSTGKTISTNISEDLQLNLRAALGPSKMITIMEKIDTWLKYYNPQEASASSRRADKKFIITIKEYSADLDYLFNAMNHNNPQKADTRLGELIGQLKAAVKHYKQKILVDTKDGRIVIRETVDKETITKENNTLYETICRTNEELVNHLQGTLANIINALKHNLFQVVDKFNEKFTANTDKITGSFNSLHTTVIREGINVRRMVNKDLPRTLLKGVGYLTCGTIAALAAFHIIWHERPLQAHLKNIGIAAGSLIGMFFVDPIVNYFRPARASKQELRELENAKLKVEHLRTV